MKRLYVAACLTLAASAAMPNPVAHHGDDWVMLTDKPCPEAIAAMVAPEYREALHAAKAVISGQPFDACWAILPGRNVASMVYSDGEGGEVPLADFKESPEV